MSVTIRGMSQLTARLNALKPSPDMMRELALQAVAEQKRLVPRATGNLGRSIRVGRVTSRSAETVAGASYAAAVEFGTRPHIIVPVRRKALRFSPRGGRRRLTGAPASGSAVVFAKRVQHPGTRKQPYMVPGAQRALRLLGIGALVKRWNEAG